jgi:hypothetical protein
LTTFQKLFYFLFSPLQAVHDGTLCNALDFGDSSRCQAFNSVEYVPTPLNLGEPVKRRKTYLAV